MDEIPAGERLFRGLRPEWAEGGHVSPDAIDLKGMSVDREALARPDSVITAERTRVASVRRQDLPQPIELFGGVMWECFVLYLPEFERDPHCEVRHRRQGETALDAQKPKSPEAKRTLRARLANAMKLVDLAAEATPLGDGIT